MGGCGQRFVGRGFFRQDPEDEDARQQDQGLDEQSVFIEEPALHRQEVDGGAEENDNPDNAYDHTFYTVLAYSDAASDE